MNIFNIDKLFPCPKINLTQLGDESLKQNDTDTILNEGDFNFLNGIDPFENSFVYDITLSNGDVISGLNELELNAFISSNKNLEYKYS